jgi:uncharacterized protein YprB with RNaseH-like and TPR domain
MARSGLAGRLGRIRQAQKSAAEIQAPEIPAAKKSTASSGGASVSLPGWKQTAPYLFERETFSDIDSCKKVFSPHLPLLFPRERDAMRRTGIASRMSNSFIFFDLETTGLSHGAGTVAFMAGLARFEPETGRLGIIQLLLADYPGEADFLSRFAELTGRDPVFVSFNGKAFDAQILFNRFALNGIASPFSAGSPLHLDLLYPSRRVWKNELESCRLSSLEEHVLGIAREDDLPGSEAPDAWFDYVRNGERDRLLAVGDHNRDDCSTLPRLLCALDDAIERGTSRAALIRAIDLRASGDYAAARLFLEPLARSGDKLALKILAIDTEHRIGDLGRALECARELGDERRTKRLLRKLESLASDGTGALP